MRFTLFNYLDHVQNLDLRRLTEMTGQMKPYARGLGRRMCLDIRKKLLQQRIVLRLVHEHAGLDDVLHLARRQPGASLAAQIIDLADLSLRDLEKETGVPQMTAGHGFCNRCGRELSNVDSVARGIGPVCLTKGKK